MKKERHGMLKPNNTILSVIDVQGELAHAMYNKETLFENLQKLIKGVKIFGIPILWTEQNPEGLGPTIPEVAILLSGIKPISKLSFSCCGNECFMEALRGLNRNQVLLAGIEAHVCIYQTAVDLVNLGYGVQVVADAVSSRTKENKSIGLEKIREVGLSLTSVETVLFELLKAAEGPKFEEILKIVK
jgi:nicotinamidase-related amidase